MIDTMLTEMVKSLLSPAPRSQPKTFRYSIPKSHPKAAKIMRLFGMLANREIRDSGLVVEREPIPGADVELIEALRELDIDVDEIKACFPKPKTFVDPSKINGDEMRALMGNPSRLLPILNEHRRGSS